MKKKLERKESDTGSDLSQKKSQIVVQKKASSSFSIKKCHSIKNENQFS